MSSSFNHVEFSPPRRLKTLSTHFAAKAESDSLFSFSWNGLMAKSCSLLFALFTLATLFVSYASSISSSGGTKFLFALARHFLNNSQHSKYCTQSFSSRTFLESSLSISKSTVSGSRRYGCTSKWLKSIASSSPLKNSSFPICANDDDDDVDVAIVGASASTKVCATAPYVRRSARSRRSLQAKDRASLTKALFTSLVAH